MFSNWFFFLLPWAVQTDQTEEFMFQNVAYRVYNIDQLYIKLGQKVVMDDNIFDVSKLCWN